MDRKLMIQRIVDAMCKHGYMHGFFGDISDEFRASQVDKFLAMPRQQQTDWLERNRFLICKITADSMNFELDQFRDG